MSQKNPHLIYIITQLELGGAQKICLHLMKEFYQQTSKASLISGTEGPLVQETTSFESVYLLKSLKNELNLKNIKNDIKVFFQLINIIKKIKTLYPDCIVHTHSTKAGIFGRWAAFFAGVKKRVHTIHGFGFNTYQSKARWFMFYFLELITTCITTKFICVSQRDIDEGSTLFPHFKEKSILIRAAVDYDRFYIPSIKNLSLKNDHVITIGSISCFKPQKNLFDLLQAFELAHHTITTTSPVSLKLQIIGDGNQRSLIEQWIFDHQLNNVIDLLGWQSNIKPWLQTWDIFTLSSLWEGLPCSVVEARLSKIPVVAYDVGGISEVIFSGKNGFLIQPGNWQELSKMFIHLTRNPKLLHSLSFYEENLRSFSHHVMIAQHHTFYQALFQK